MAIKVLLLLVALGMVAVASALKNGFGKCPAERATAYDGQAEKLNKFILIKSEEGLPTTVAEMTPFCAESKALLETTKGIITDCVTDPMIRNPIISAVPRIEKVLDRLCKDDEGRQFAVDLVKECGVVTKPDLQPIIEKYVDLAARAAEEKNATVRISALCNAFDDSKEETDPILKAKCPKKFADFLINMRMEFVSLNFYLIVCSTKDPKIKKIDNAATDPPTSVLTSLLRLAALGLEGRGLPGVKFD